MDNPLTSGSVLCRNRLTFLKVYISAEYTPANFLLPLVQKVSHFPQIVRMRLEVLNFGLQQFYTRVRILHPVLRWRLLGLCKDLVNKWRMDLSVTTVRLTRGEKTVRISLDDLEVGSM